MYVVSTTKNKSCGSYIPAAANSIPAPHPGAKQVQAFNSQEEGRKSACTQTLEPELRMHGVYSQQQFTSDLHCTSYCIMKWAK
jgi:hypothetical protein